MSDSNYNCKFCFPILRNLCLPIYIYLKKKFWNFLYATLFFFQKDIFWKFFACNSWSTRIRTILTRPTSILTQNLIEILFKQFFTLNYDFSRQDLGLLEYYVIFGATEEHRSSHLSCYFLETTNKIPFSLSIINIFWSSRSQMIDLGQIMQYYLILWRKFYDYHWKFITFEQKRVLSLGFSEKNTSLKRTKLSH